MEQAVAIAQTSVSEVLIISKLAMPRSLSRSCGGGLGWGQTRVVFMLRHPHPTPDQVRGRLLPRKRERG